MASEISDYVQPKNRDSPGRFTSPAALGGGLTSRISAISINFLSPAFEPRSSTLALLVRIAGVSWSGRLEKIFG
jgi:hypothetical protein